MDTCEPPREQAPRSEEVVQQARALIESHPQFVGRSRLFSFEHDGDTLVIHGAVPTFYLKQMLQTALRSLDGVRRIDNRVSVGQSQGCILSPDRSALS